MTSSVPSLQEIYTRQITDFIIAYNTGRPDDEKITPALKGNPEGALVYSSAQQSDSLYKFISLAVKQLFLDTATGEFLERLANRENITRNPATTSSGTITVTGTISTSIPLGRIFLRTDGTQYKTLTAVSIANLVFSVSTITRSGSIVTVTTVSAHGLSPNMSMTIAGANETDYNGTFKVESVISDTQFTYLITTTPSSPATGTILMDYDGVFVNVESIEKGQAVNSPGGDELTLATPIAGINSAFVQFSQLGGGADEENDEELRARALYKSQNPNVAFNVAQITNQAKLVSGVTRVWVNENTPDVGEVTIYFVRDKDDDIFPTPGEVSDVKDSILLIKYAVVSDALVTVSAPTPVTVNFTFSSLSPNTAEMQNAINESLDNFFRSQTNEGENIPLTLLESIIYQTIDDSGNTPIFVLSSPAANITVNAGELGKLGIITYP